MKPNCYDCEHRRPLNGDCHSGCNLLDTKTSFMASAFFMMGNTELKCDKFQIRGNTHGVRSGWFNWPLNFDPVWLEICTEFKQKGGESMEKKENKETQSFGSICNQPSNQSYNATNATNGTH